MDNQVNNEFDRTFKYDFAGRLTANSFGVNQNNVSPYTQTAAYDAFSQMTSRQTTHWGNNNFFDAVYVNGRKQASGNQYPAYDAAGNMVNSGTRNDSAYEATTFDAANRPKVYTSRFKRLTGRVAYTIFETSVEHFYDGDGHPIKYSKSEGVMNQSPNYQLTMYQMWSSVLGNTLTEITETGAKAKTNIYAGGAIIAEQNPGLSGVSNPSVEWKHADPVTGSSITVPQSGDLTYSVREEYEPLGQSVEPTEPPQDIPPGENSGELDRADEAEWHCDITKGDFWAMPTECKVAALKRGSVSFLDLHYKEGTVAEISKQITDSPMPKMSIPFQSSPTENVMAFAKRATSKSDEDDKNPDSPNNIKERTATVNVFSNTVPGFVDAEFARQTKSGLKVGLNDKDQKKYEKEKGKLLNRLQKISPECNELLAKVGGLAEVVKAIKLQQAFDGETSTISAFEAGILGNDKLDRLDDANKRASKEQSIAYRFKYLTKDTAATTALYQNGESVKEVDDRSDVYFRPDRHWYGYGQVSGLTQRTILHEAIHSLTGLEDIELLEKLTGKIETSPGVASKGISAALINKGCVK